MERFTRRELTLLAAALAAAVVAGAFVWTNYQRAFPEASITFAVSRSTSQPIAERFLSEHAPVADAALGDRRHAALFRVETPAKLYLERTLGLERLGELTRTRQVVLWTWSHRYFRPLDKEEVQVEVAPSGEVVGFSHLLAEEAPGETLEEPDARAKAEAFLASALGLERTGLEFIEASHEDRKARRDWTFTFERAGFKAGEGTWRVQAEVHGGEVAAVKQFLKVPDAWTQSYQRLRSANQTASMFSMLGILVTMIAAVWVLIRASRRGNVRWRPVILLTVAGFVLVALTTLNDLPMAAYSFDTTGSWGGFLAKQLMFALAAAGVQALVIFVVVAAGEPEYRAGLPGQLRVASMFERSGWGSKRFVTGMVLGYCLALLFIGYQVAFYLVAGKLGAWNPADIPFDNLLNTAFPWLAVLFMGFFPSVSEEFISRVFSVPLVARLTRSRLLALAVPALIWGFGHANYPAQPFYIRGVEVAIAGVLVGLILLRFGVLPCLVWHYVVDAGYTSILLVRSGNPYFVVTAILGTAALLVPLVLALIAAGRRGGFLPDSGLRNADDPAPALTEPVAAAPAEPIEAPAWRRLLAPALALPVIGLLLLRGAPDPGKDVGVHLRPAQVRTAAEEFLRGRGADPATWRLVVVTREEVLDPLSRRYLLEHGGVERVAETAATVPEWQVRAFRPEEREEWQLAVDDASKRVVRFRHLRREEEAGASLEPAQAREAAEGFLRSQGFDPAALVFKEASSERRPARMDHVFTFKDPSQSVADAEALLTVTVQGNAVDGLERRLKIPEVWERGRERTTVFRVLLVVVKVLLAAYLIMRGLLALYHALRVGAIPWRGVAGGAAAVAVCALVAAALNLPLAWLGYPTAWPAANFQTSTLIGMVIAVLVQGGAATLVLATLVAAFPHARAVLAAARRRTVAVSSLLAGVVVVGLALVADGLVAVLRGKAPTLFPDAGVALPSALGTALPGLAALGNAGGLVVAFLAMGGLAAFTLGNVRGPKRIVLLAGAAIALVPSAASASWPELVTAVALGGVALAVGWLVARFVLGRNPVAWLLAAWWLAMLATAGPLLAQPGSAYRMCGAVALTVAFVGGALFAGWPRRRQDA